MAEGGIDDSIGGNAEDQFASVHAGGKLRFREKTVVGAIVEFKDSIQDCRIIGEAGQHGRAAIGELRGNQPMGIALIDWTNREHGLLAAATAIEQASDADHAGYAPADQQFEWRRILEHQVTIRP